MACDSLSAWLAFHSMFQTFSVGFCSRRVDPHPSAHLFQVQGAISTRHDSVGGANASRRPGLFLPPGLRRVPSASVNSFGCKTPFRHGLLQRDVQDNNGQGHGSTGGPPRARVSTTRIPTDLSTVRRVTLSRNGCAPPHLETPQLAIHSWCG